MKRADLQWIRTAKAAEELTNLKKPWIIAFAVRGAARPTNCPFMKALVSRTNVDGRMVKVGAMLIGVVCHGVQVGTLRCGEAAE